MNKKTGIILGVIGGVIALAIIVVVGLSLINKNNDQAYVNELNAVPGVHYAMYEVQHPGVPWNNSYLIFAVMDITTAKQVAESTLGILNATSKKFGTSQGISVYIVNADEVEPYQYNERAVYFKEFYLGGTDKRQLLKDASQLIPGSSVFENSIKT